MLYALSGRHKAIHDSNTAHYWVPLVCCTRLWTLVPFLSSSLTSSLLPSTARVRRSPSTDRLTLFLGIPGISARTTNLSFLCSNSVNYNTCACMAKLQHSTELLGSQSADFRNASREYKSCSSCINIANCIQECSKRLHSWRICRGLRSAHRAPLKRRSWSV